MGNPPTLALNVDELREPIPDWLPGRYKAENQLKLFVRWVCRIHFGVSERELVRVAGIGKRSPFKGDLTGTALRRACFELVVYLGRVMEIEDLQTEELTGMLVALNTTPVVRGEYGDWHTLATNFRELWLSNQPKEETE